MDTSPDNQAITLPARRAAPRLPDVIRIRTTVARGRWARTLALPPVNLRRETLLANADTGG